MNDFDKHVEALKKEIESAIYSGLRSDGCHNFSEVHNLIKNLANDVWEMGYEDGQDEFLT